MLNGDQQDTSTSVLHYVSSNICKVHLWG